MPLASLIVASVPPVLVTVTEVVVVDVPKSMLPAPPVEAIVTVPAASVIVTLLPAVSVRLSDVSKVLPPAVIGLRVTLALLAVISEACCVVIPVLSVFADISDACVGVIPTLAVLAVISFACAVVIPVFAVLATTSVFALTLASV